MVEKMLIEAFIYNNISKNEIINNAKKLSILNHKLVDNSKKYMIYYVKPLNECKIIYIYSVV